MPRLRLIAAQRAPPRSWCAALIFMRAKVLRDVETPSQEAAEAAAVRTFDLSPEQPARGAGAGLRFARSLNLNSPNSSTPCG